jgi:DnaK suppressor protein
VAVNESPQSETASGLDRTQLDELRELLLEARAEALDQLHEQEATARAAEPLPEPMDAAELAREQGDAATLLERARRRLRDVDDALAKMTSDRYGLSERTGQAIGFDRLRAVPWARLGADEAE